MKPSPYNELEAYPTAVVAQPIVTDTAGRSFACFPVAVLVFIVSEEGKILLLSHPEREGQWQIVKGAVEAGETIQEASLREVREEVGSGVCVRPLGTVHAATAWHDDAVGLAVGVFYLMAYEGGVIKPGDDMDGSQFRWVSVEEIESGCIQVSVPRETWIVRRAVALYRLWANVDSLS